MPGQNGRRFPDVRLLIFDLDGTLIDSKEDLALSVNATLAHLGRAPLAPETIYGYVGDGAPMLVCRALGPQADESEFERGLVFFLEYYREHMLDNTVTYPGVREALEQLRSRSMAVLTNKPMRFSDKILEGLGISNYFRFVFGGDSFKKKKPDPVGILKLLAELSVEPHQAMMVGDSRVDVRTARNAGVWACGVTYGLGAEGLREDPPDILLDNLNLLPNHLEG